MRTDGRHPSAKQSGTMQVPDVWLLVSVQWESDACWLSLPVGVRELRQPSRRGVRKQQGDIQSGGHAVSRSRTLESTRRVWTFGLVRVPLVHRMVLRAQPQGQEPTCEAFTPGRGPSHGWRWECLDQS